MNFARAIIINRMVLDWLLVRCTSIVRLVKRFSSLHGYPSNWYTINNRTIVKTVHRYFVTAIAD